jgi:hypothetical protein
VDEGKSKKQELRIVKAGTARTETAYVFRAYLFLAGTRDERQKGTGPVTDNCH